MMNMTRIRSHLSVALKHSALAVALIAASGTAHATLLNNIGAGGTAGVSGYYTSPGNAQYTAGDEGYTPHVSGSWSGFLDPWWIGMYFGSNTTFKLTADPGYTVTLMDFQTFIYGGNPRPGYTVLDHNGTVMATVAQGVANNGDWMSSFGWSTLTDTQLTIVFATDQTDNAGISNIKFSEQALPPALIAAFGPGAVINQDLKTIAWTVPYGTPLTTLTPTITLSSGVCVPASGESPVLDGSNQASYTVTDTSTDPITENPYILTVTVAPIETTLLWDVGSGDWDLATFNWKGQASGALMPYFNGVNTIFGKTAGGTITIAPDMAPLTTTVSATSGSYIFTGNPITSGSLTKSGGGTLELRTTPSSFSSTTVNGGTLYLQAEGPDGFGFDPVTMTNVTVNAGGLLLSQHANLTGNLTMNGGTYTETSGWSGSWSGTIELAADSTIGAIGYGGLYLNAPISGPGGLTVTIPAGGVVLGNANTYAGPTILQSGRLECNNVDSLGNGGALTIASGAKVRLNYTGDHVVSALTLGGSAKPPGTYGSSSSPATFKNDTFFDSACAGTVTVPGTPPPLITSFGLPGNPANIDQTANTIVWAVPTSDVTQLAPTFTLTSGTCNPASGTTQDFTSPVHYIVDDGGITNDYLVTVTVVPPLPVLDGLTLWLDASATNTMTPLNPADGAFVSQWRDQYGGSIKMDSINIISTSPAWVQSSGIGGKPALRFTTENRPGDWWYGSTMADGYNHQAPVTVIYVGRMTGLGDAGTQRVVGANDWVLGYHGGSMDRAAFGGWVENTNMAADTNPHIFVGTIGGPGTDSTFYRDGAMVASNQNGTTGPNNLQLAGDNIWYEVSDCEVAEVLVYNRVLTADELTSVNSYLTGKYPLATTAPYGTWASTHGLTGTAGSSTDPAFDADPNKDGVANGLVWLIGGAAGDPLANSNSILPVPADDGGKLVLSFKCLKSSARGTANLTVQYSTDLGVGDAWHGVPVPDSDQPDAGSGVGFVVAPIVGSNYNNVTATIASPALGSKLFGRLVATEN